MTSPWKHPLLYLGALFASLYLLGTSGVARDLYWTEQKQILASDIDGQNVTVIFDGETSSPPMASYAVDIAVTDTHIYWSGHSGGDIWRANRDGTGAEQLVTGSGASIHFLEINDATGKIYFSGYNNGIYSANLADGSAVTNFYAGNPGAFAGLVLDSTTTSGVDELLWVSAGSTWLYRTVPEWWSTSAEVELEGGNATYGLVLDASTGTVFYTNFSEHTLRSYNLTTQEHELLWTPGMTSPLGVKLSPSGTHLLIAERGRGVSGYEIATGGYELLAASTNAHFGVAATADPGTLEVPPPPPPPPPPPEDGDAVFAADFEDDTEGGLPRLTSEGGVWTNWVPRGTPDSVYVVRDESNLFGYGADNQFLRVDNSIGNYMDAHLNGESEVVTMSFDTILRRTTVASGGHERNGFGFFGPGGRLHLFSLAGGGGIRGGGGGSVPIHQRTRVDVVFNNSADEITYTSPEGVEHTLPSTHAAVWVEGALVNSHTPSGRGGAAATGSIDYVRLPHFSSTDRYSMDIDNFTVFMGAHVYQQIVEGVDPGPLPEPEPLPVVWSLSPGDRGYLATGTQERGLALHPDGSYLLVVHRDAPPTVGVIDAMTGADLGVLSVEGVTGGFSNFHLNKIAIAEDGTIYAGNLAVDTRNDNYRLYRWANKDADPELVFDAPLNSADESAGNRRFGDSLVVLGTGEETEILLDTWNATAWARLTPLADPVDPNNQLGAEMVTLADEFDSMRDIVAGPNGFIYGAKGGFLYEMAVDRTTMTATLNEAHPVTASLGPVGFSADGAFLGGIEPGTSRFYLFNTGNYFNPAAINAFPTDNPNGNGTGAVVFGESMVYALNTDNGILAMSLDIPSGTTFGSWIAGFDLPVGQEGPGDNPAGDGIRNLMKYALGLDPTEPSRDGLPVSGIGSFTVDDAAANYLTLTFTRPDAVDDVGYAVRVSGELGSWPAEAILEEAISNGDGTTTYTYRDTEPVESASRRFMHLEVILLD